MATGRPSRPGEPETAPRRRTRLLAVVIGLGIGSIGAGGACTSNPTGSGNPVASPTAAGPAASTGPTTTTRVVAPGGFSSDEPCGRAGGATAAAAPAGLDPYAVAGARSRPGPTMSTTTVPTAPVSRSVTKPPNPDENAAAVQSDAVAAPPSTSRIPASGSRTCGPGADAAADGAGTSGPGGFDP